jgi:hypothetical protein
MQRAINVVVRKTIYVRAWLMTRRWLRRAPREHRRYRRMRQGFEKRLYRKWAPGLAWLDVFMMHVHDEAMAFSARQSERAEDENDELFYVLRRLHARACRVASEVAALLRTGHAEGAMARWRTLHELAVTAEFISKHGKEMARRYHEHVYVRQPGAMTEYNAHASRWGGMPFSTAEQASAREARDALIARYGKEYGESYGWAASVLWKTRRDGTRMAPTLAEIEASVEMSHHRPWYRLASEGQHAGPKPLEFTLPLSEGLRDVLLTGASDVGLYDPGTHAAASLLLATLPFLTCRTDVRAASAIASLTALRNAVFLAFERSYESIDYADMSSLRVHHTL